MLTRRNVRFRWAAESAEWHCREAGVHVGAEAVDRVARSWVARVAEELGVSAQVALTTAPHDLGQLIAGTLIEAEHRNRLNEQPFGRDAVVYVSVRAETVCARCFGAIAVDETAASVRGGSGRSLIHRDCL